MLGPGMMLIGTPAALGAAVEAVRKPAERTFGIAALAVLALGLIALLLPLFT